VTTVRRYTDCPACGRGILVVSGSRDGGQLVALDPSPLPDGDTRLSGDGRHVVMSGEALARLRGTVPLYRLHVKSCPERLGLPAGTPLPGFQGYHHKPDRRPANRGSDA
jgi:hypothetical protein